MRTRESMRQLTATVMLFVGIANLPIANAATSDDPPDRVARISYLKGEVSLKPAGTDEWALTTLNRPLTTDDQLSLDRHARAELQAGSVIIHLDAGAAFSFSELSDTVLQARLTVGALHLTVRRLQNDEVIEIDTPHAAVTVSKPGDYRIEVLDDGARTLVKTYSGEAEVAGNSESVRVGANEQATLDETGQSIAMRGSFTPRDEFDQWAQGRNERFSRSASSRYVAPDVIGYEDLDGYGDWTSEVDYGHVWYPRIAVGWAPYRDGHWTWISPWGWTWVDDAPWGFAPFHYGRWAHVHGRWGWVPGPIHVRAVYAPALVAWVGGPHISMSVSFGSHVGWFPLGPREVYVPGYRCSPRHIHNVNYANTVIVNNTIINRAYVNRSTRIDYQHRAIRDAVTVVSRDTFVSARPVSNHRVHNRDVRDWQTHNASPAIAPHRASTLGPRWNANERVVNHGEHSANRTVVTRRTPPSPRVSFDQEQRVITENRNRPVTRSDLQSNARTEALRTSRNEFGQRNNTLIQDDRPRRTFDRLQEEMRPITRAPQTEIRSPNNSPREREAPRFDAPRVRESIERQVEQQPARQPDRQPERQLERPRENIERQRPAERTERVEEPRRYEPPQREQRQEPVQRQAPAANERRDDGQRSRGNRHTVER